MYCISQNRDRMQQKLLMLNELDPEKDAIFLDTCNMDFYRLFDAFHFPDFVCERDVAFEGAGDFLVAFDRCSDNADNRLSQIDLVLEYISRGIIVG